MNIDLARNNILVKDGYAFFWGSQFSNWYKSNFIIEDVTFTSSEQYMMYEKAQLFGDKETATKILKTSDPKKQKALGRLVQNYRDDLWNTHRFDVVYEGCFEKFYQNKDLGQLLLATKDLILVEASPYDTIWGIGMGVDNPDITDESKWRGQNLLGKVLMKVRDTLKSIGE